MSKRWIDTKSDAEAVSFAAEFWSALRRDHHAGDFWADRIKQYRAEPLKRLSFALKQLPLPAAFREAAIATRALIREKRKEKKREDADGKEDFRSYAGFFFFCFTQLIKSVVKVHRLSVPVRNCRDKKEAQIV